MKGHLMNQITKTYRAKRSAAVLAGLLFGVTAAFTTQSAQALVIEGDYTVNVHSQDPGLVVHTSDIFDHNFTLDLELNVPQTVKLFRIWTDENTVNAGEDNVAHPASVDWIFSSPVGSDSSTGETHGGWRLFVFQHGEINWDNPTVITFDSGAELQITLTDRHFNKGLFGLKEGYRHGAKVKATFLLTKEGNYPIPEPATLALFGLGLFGLGLAVRANAQQASLRLVRVRKQHRRPLS